MEICVRVLQVDERTRRCLARKVGKKNENRFICDLVDCLVKKKEKRRIKRNTNRSLKWGLVCPANGKCNTEIHRKGKWNME